jgi:predicted transposase/invertase (TIGR01784 family)
MVKWRKVNEKDIANEPLHRWLAWFDPGSDPDLVAEVIRMDNAIQKANKRQEHVLSDEEALRIYEMREKAEWDYLAAQKRALRLGREEGLKEGLEEGREEGLEEGLKKGRAENTLEIARKMKYAGMRFSEISEFTGLAQEQIQSL